MDMLSHVYASLKMPRCQLANLFRKFQPSLLAIHPYFLLPVYYLTAQQTQYIHIYIIF